MDSELMTLLAQSGVAGVIGVLWVLERRAASAREKQIGQAHERILEQRVQLEQLLRVISDNTRAITSLESAQRAIGSMLSGRRDAGGDA